MPFTWRRLSIAAAPYSQNHLPWKDESMADRWYPLVRAFIRLYGAVKDRTGRNLPGLGFALRRLRSGRVLDVHGRRFWFDPTIAQAYGRVVGGAWNEPETHAFLRSLLDDAPAPVTFVDVGASIGAMVLDVAAHPNAGDVHAFEPHPQSEEACRRSAELSGLGNVKVRRLALSDGGETRMRFDSSPSTSALDPGGEPVPGGTLDGELNHVLPPAILLLDVEGSEPAVLRGGGSFLRRCRPVVIFEYHALGSDRPYPLEEVQDILGSDYHIFRLRVDGRLDGRTDEAWNCVAVAAGSPFEETCRRLHVD